MDSVAIQTQSLRETQAVATADQQRLDEECLQRLKVEDAKAKVRPQPVLRSLRCACLSAVAADADTTVSAWRLWLIQNLHCACCLKRVLPHVQENGVQNDAEAECSGLEVTSAFTANVWEVHHLKLMP